MTYDGRGNGLSDRPTDPDAPTPSERFVDDIVAVMDATGTDAAVLVGLCGDGVWRTIQFAVSQPERVLGIVAFAVGVPRLSPPHPWRVRHSFDDELPTDEGWAKLNRHYWRRDYPGFVPSSSTRSRPSRTPRRQIEDAVAWALDGSLEAMLADMRGAERPRPRSVVEALPRGPLSDAPRPRHRGPLPAARRAAQRLAELTGAPLVIVEGAEPHDPRPPSRLANLLIREFVASLAGRSR